MNPITLDRYKSLLDLLAAARAETASCRARFEEAASKEQALASEVAEAEATIERALATLDMEPAPAEPDRDFLDDMLAEATAQDIDAPDGIRPSFWEVIRLIPRDGKVSLADLRPHFKLTEGALGARLGKCKKAGLIESAGWGEYRLTQKAKDLLGLRLKVVS